MPVVSRRYFVEGRVQGVYFRDSTRQVAERLGITGHAINLRDGRVEVECHGEHDAIAKLEAWLHEGPPMSRVDTVHAEDIKTAPAARFSTG